MRRCLDDDPAGATVAVHVYSPASDSSILVMYRRRLNVLERSTYTLYNTTEPIQLELCLYVSSL